MQPLYFLYHFPPLAATHLPVFKQSGFSPPPVLARVSFTHRQHKRKAFVMKQGLSLKGKALLLVNVDLGIKPLIYPSSANRSF
jgi:hypothetical protein